MLKSIEDLHIIFQLALVQALNCTYGVHPNRREVVSPGSRFGGYSVSQDPLLSYTDRSFMMEEPAEQATGLRLLSFSTRTRELAVAQAPG